MPRKFSFNLPPLKIGQSRAEKALREHLAPVVFDSPPPTPKSVRPPLSPLVEAELRAACSYVLQNYKPSHIVYQERYGYAAVEDADSKCTEAPTRAADLDACTKEAAATNDEAHEEPPISAKYRYKPNVAREDLFKDDDSQKRMLRQAKARAGQTVLAEPGRTEASMRRLSGLCLRSPPRPAQSSQVSLKEDSGEQPNGAPETGPTETVGSTPQTDATEEPWSDKASTAMTSMPITPARSKRTSSHAHSGSEASSVPKIESVNANWMREQLEKHKKSQEEQQQDGAREDKDPDVINTEIPTQLAAPPMSPASSKCPKRKPVPVRSESTEEIEIGKGENRQDSKGSVVQSLSQTSEGIGESASGRKMAPSDRIENHGSVKSDQTRARPPSRARSITRQVKEYIRPASAQRASRADEFSRQSSQASSRAANVTRNVKEYFRPATGTSSRKASLDATVRTSRSIDSFRTARSDMDTTPATSAGGNWNSWKSFHHKDKIQGTDASRHTTSDTSTEPRGRTASRDVRQTRPSQAQQPKQPINLNRELPPLPSLDQWKPKESEGERASCYTETMFQERPNPLGSHKPSIDLIAAVSSHRKPPYAIVPQEDHKKPRRRSRSIQSLYPPEYHEHAQVSPKRQVMNEENVIIGKAHAVNCARVPPGTTLSRESSSKIRPTPTAIACPPSHRRSTSEHHHHPNFSRKVSMDDHNAPRSTKEDRLLPNLAEISATPRPPRPSGSEKEQRKWWQRKAKKAVERDGLDGVVKSGTRGGVLLTDEVAAAPIVRY
ncbi:hypothetical protein M433DRAFT_157345 [Acidomyces richmondensis BFW]|nr:MAG: hypothetical protein FE78DRAFT_85401 [Acidomyces sp. 'richmondensis']KYG42906.1 hypothetical protein M433DRAFT_157345 [Acidomyces richmondensis BFW]